MASRRLIKPTGLSSARWGRLAPSRGVLGQLQNLAVRPEGITVEFGIELTGKTRSILVAAGASAQLEVGLTWRPAAASVGEGSSRTEGAGTEDTRPEA